MEEKMKFILIGAAILLPFVSDVSALNSTATRDVTEKILYSTDKISKSFLHQAELDINTDDPNPRIIVSTSPELSRKSFEIAKSSLVEKLKIMEDEQFKETKERLEFFLNLIKENEEEFDIIPLSFLVQSLDSEL